MKKQKVFITLILVLILSLLACSTPAAKPIEGLILYAPDTLPSAGAPLPLELYVHEPSDKDLRQIIVISCYDTEGNPKSLGGSGTTPSLVDLYSDPSAVSVLHHKTVQNHQAVYVPNEITTNLWLAVSNDDAANCSIALDVILQSRPSEEDQWHTTDQQSVLIRNTDSDIDHTPSIPQLAEPHGFQWELKDGVARLCGIGTITASDIVIPSSVCLAEGPPQPDAYKITPTLMSQGSYFPKLGSAYDLEMTDGTIVSDLHALTSTQYLAARLFVYDVNGFVEDFTNGSLPTMTLSLRSGTFFQTQSIGFTIIPEEYSKDAPLILYIASNAANYRYIEDPVNGTEYPVQVIGDAFYNCDAITTVFFEDGVTYEHNRMNGAKGGAFAYCDSLTAVENIPSSVTDMQRTFECCRSLTSPPEIPDGVLDMRFCFYECTALEKAPDIPASVTCVYFSFYNCSAMTGTATIPEGALNPSDYISCYEAFWNCTSLDVVYLEGCPLFPYRAYITNIPTEFLGKHITQGVCKYCLSVGQRTELLGNIFVVFDRISDGFYADFITFMETEVPESLKQYCYGMVLTPDLGQYIGMEKDVTYLRGYTQLPACNTFILATNNIVPKYTIYHELAHCYDYSVADGSYISASPEWVALHEAEGAKASTRYNQEEYLSYSPSHQQQETFAIAVGCYFEYSGWLKYHCPGMYEFIDNIFG